MTLSELRIKLNYLGWSQAKLARRVKYDPSTIGRWEEVPFLVSEYVEMVYRARERWEALK